MESSLDTFRAQREAADHRAADGDDDGSRTPAVRRVDEMALPVSVKYSVLGVVAGAGVPCG